MCWNSTQTKHIGQLSINNTVALQNKKGRHVNDIQINNIKSHPHETLFGKTNMYCC